MSLACDEISGDDLTHTPSNHEERLRSLMGEVTPSPKNKVPMSLQKDMRGTNQESTVTTFSSSASKLASSGYSSESFQKTFSEFGQIISQRRAELSEMKRANQFRMANQLKHDLSTPLSDSKSVSDGLSSSKSGYSQHSVETQSDQIDTPILHDKHKMMTPGSASSSRSASHHDSDTDTSGIEGGSRLARRLILSHQKTVTYSEESSTSSSHGSSLTLDIAAEQPQSDQQTGSPTGRRGSTSPSVINAMAEQLKGEQERTRELNIKINDLHALEESQRTRALGLAQEKDK
jgi:hypothetical protein